MLTRIEVDAEEVSRTKGALATVGRSVVVDGTNADLSFILATVLGRYGVNPTSRSSVADADLAQLDDSLEGRFLDEVEIEILDKCQNDFLFSPERKSFPTWSVDFGNNAQYLEAKLARLRAQFEARYTQAGGGIRIGRMRRRNTHQMRTGEYFAPRLDCILPDAEGCSVSPPCEE